MSNDVFSASEAEFLTFATIVYASPLKRLGLRNVMPFFVKML
jgi:hypothetical protein